MVSAFLISMDVQDLTFAKVQIATNAKGAVTLLY